MKPTRETRPLETNQTTRTHPRGHRDDARLWSKVLHLRPSHRNALQRGWAEIEESGLLGTSRWPSIESRPTTGTTTRPIAWPTSSQVKDIRMRGRAIRPEHPKQPCLAVGS